MRIGGTAKTLAAGLVWVVLTGCASTLPKVQPRVIESHRAEQPQVRWQYPAPAEIAATDPATGLSGLVKPRPIPSYLPDVEPPLVTAMHVLPDGALVFVSPLRLEYESARYVFGKYTRETTTRVRVVVLEGETGRERWATEIEARGVFDVMDVGGMVLLQSRYFEPGGDFVEGRLFALRPTDGELAWTRESPHPLRFVSFAPDGSIVLSPAVPLREERPIVALSAESGAVRWQITVPPAEGDAVKLALPVLAGANIVLFDRGVESRRLKDGAIVWHRRDLRLRGSAQPEVAGDVIWLQSTRGVEALDLATGTDLWTQPAIEGDATRLVVAGSHLFVTHTEEGFFSDSYVLSLLEAGTGRIVWSHETEPLLGNVVHGDGVVFLTTSEELVALDERTGQRIFDEDLPWDDEFSPHVLSMLGGVVVVRNEWNAAAWRPDGERVYHHAFEPLCPIVTTQERMLEARQQGRTVVGGVNVSGQTYSSASTVAFHESRYRQAMSAYRATGDSSHLSTAELHLRSAHNTERMAASMELNKAIMGAVVTVGAVALNGKIATSHGLVYPAIDSVIHHIRDRDTRDYSVRLVGLTDDGQRLSALEILELRTGRSRRIVLSPYQMPYDLKTVGSHRMTATEISGYLPAAVLLGHAFSTVVDLQRGRVFHYGPGLDVDGYVEYADTGFLRGKLIMLPLELP